MTDSKRLKDAMIALGHQPGRNWQSVTEDGYDTIANMCKDCNKIAYMDHGTVRGSAMESTCKYSR